MNNREKVYELCKKSKTAEEISWALGLKMSTIYSHIKHLREEGFIVSTGNRIVGAPVVYVATKKKGLIALGKQPPDAPPKHTNQEIDWFYPRMLRAA